MAGGGNGEGTALRPDHGLDRVHVTLVEEVDAPAEGACRQGAVVGIGATPREGDELSGSEGTAVGGPVYRRLGRLPAVTVMGGANVLLTPSDTVSRTV